ncbi:sporulation histidine kinase inhibitor Sda [Cytobacillus sp. FJAT-54145]|uniref:Sporulation histidine kinase inhibitor Sda n=1 Tax=Cytobacillus spartinae TaxID=3299023 RepID=A0ABW6KBE2_9BACI
MRHVPERILLDSYMKAMKLKLDTEFIELLEEEIKRRDLVMKAENYLLKKKKFNLE